MESINASAQEETHVASATMKTNVENRRAHPLLLQNRRRKAMGNILRNSEVRVRLGRDFEDRAKTTSVGNARTPRVISWHPPVCQNYKTDSGCKFSE